MMPEYDGKGKKAFDSSRKALSRKPFHELSKGRRPRTSKSVPRNTRRGTGPTNANDVPLSFDSFLIG